MLRSVDPFSDALPTFSLYRLMNCSVEVRGVLMIDQHYGQVKTMQAADPTRIAQVLCAQHSDQLRQCQREHFWGSE